MKYVSFKDKEFYKKLKYAAIHRLMYITETHVAVELELYDFENAWILTMPFDHEIKQWEEELKQGIKVKSNQENLAFYAKYRKWQKRKLYTKEEFETLFDPLE
jgi:hypothetical protein